MHRIRLQISFLHAAAVALVIVLLTSTQAQVKTSSNSASATLHIQITLVPIVQNATAVAPVPPQTGSVSYTLPTNSASGNYAAVTTQSTQSLSPNEQSVLQTTTVVPK